MHFSLSAKPPKPKPKKAKDKVVVRSSGRGGSGNIRKKAVPKTPPVVPPTPSTSGGADTMSIASGSVMTGFPGPMSANDAASSKLSRITSGQSKTTGSASLSPDGGEAEDKIMAPVGREILTAKHRKIYSGRGGSGNAHKLVADESVYQRVLLHEQGILQAYKEERKERASRSTGRGGSGNIRKKKSATGSDTSSTRTRSSGRSWNSITRRYRNASAMSTVSVSELSLSPIPSLRTLPNNDFGSPLSSSILEQAGIFERVEEEDESQFAGPSASSHVTTNQSSESSHRQQQQHPLIKVVVTADTDNAATPVSSGPVASSSSGVQSRAQPPRSPASKPISPSAIASGSWIANRLQEPVFSGGIYRTPSPNASSSYSMNSSVSSLPGRSMSVPVMMASSSKVDGSQASDVALSGEEPSLSPSTTPTQPLTIRKTGSANALNMPHRASNDQLGTARVRASTLNSNQNNRNISIYNTQTSEGSPEDPLALYTSYDMDPSYVSSLPYLTTPNPSATPPPFRKYSTPPPNRALPPSPSASKALDLPKSHTREVTRHSREMSTSSTSGSDLDLSRYNFPDAPGHQPTVLPRAIETQPLHMVVEAGNGGAMLSRVPPEPRQAPPQPQPQQPQIASSSPPRTASRAPVLPGAYQAALRSAMEAEVPDGPPPLYQPRASRRYHTDLSQDQDYPEPSTPTSYSPYRVASPAATPAKGPSARLIDTSNATLRPSQRATVPASPLSEVYSPAESGSPTEKYPPEVRPNEKAHYGVVQRSGSGGAGAGVNPTRRPSDPYHRILAAAAKSSTPPPPPPLIPGSRRGSSSYSQNQGLSPSSAVGSHSFNSDNFDQPYEYASSDPRSRPPSQAFSTYTRATRHSTWGASQATATAVDHHELDFPQEDDDGVFYTSMLADLDGYENDRGRMFKEAILAKGLRSSNSTNGKEPLRMMAFPSPPLPQMPRHLVTGGGGKHQAFSEPALSRSPSRQLPTPPLGPSATPTPGPAHPYFPGGMGWDEFNRPVPRKLSKMEKALLRRVEFGPNITAGDVVAIPLA